MKRQRPGQKVQQQLLVKITRSIAVKCLAVLCGMVVMIGSLSPQNIEAAPGFEDTASWDEAKDAAAVLSYGMTPISGEFVADGTYEVSIESSSSYFRLSSAELTVQDSVMTAEVHFDSMAYTYVFAGTPEEAAAADESDFIPCEDTGMETVFTFPVKALNQALPCAAFSKKREKWYGRMILFDASSLPEGALDVDLPDYELIEEALETAGSNPSALVQEIVSDGTQSGEQENRDLQNDEAETDGGGTGTASAETNGSSSGETSTETDGNATAVDAVAIDLEDGEYSIEADMSGGSGRATISSPMLLTVKGGRAYATVLWSSRYYDYMLVNGVKYLNESEEGAPSSFTVPILAMDEPFTMIADTTAMDEPVEITYTFTFYRDTVASKSMIPQEAAKKVLIVAAVIIVVGGILNYFMKKRRKQ